MFNAISAVASLISSAPLSPVGGRGLLDIPSALDALMPKGGAGGAKSEVLDDWCGTKPHPFPFPFPPPSPPLGGGLLGPGQLGHLIGEVLGPGGSGGGLLGPGQLGNLIGDVLETRFGRVSLVRAVLAVAIAVLAALALWRPRRAERSLAIAAGVLGVAIALTPALSGHARVAGDVAVVSDWVHVLAASAWIGGLAFLLLALWRAGGERWRCCRHRRWEHRNTSSGWCRSSWEPPFAVRFPVGAPASRAGGFPLQTG